MCGIAYDTDPAFHGIFSRNKIIVTDHHDGFARASGKTARILGQTDAIRKGYLSAPRANHCLVELQRAAQVIDRRIRRVESEWDQTIGSIRLAESCRGKQKSDQQERSFG